MNISTLASRLIPALFVAAAGVAFADADGSPSDGPPRTSNIARAEVLADLQIWRSSGMAALQGGEAGADVFSHAYRVAAAAYDAQRNSPEFALLVTQIARQRGEVVDIAGK